MIYIILLGLTMWSATVLGTDVKLSWNANTEPDLAGYIAYYGTASHVYSTTALAGTQTSATFLNLAPATYYFAVVAFDSSGNASDYSQEVSLRIKKGKGPQTRVSASQLKAALR